MTHLALPDKFPFHDLCDEHSGDVASATRGACHMLAYSVDHMHVSDIDQVMQIERVAFPAPWPASAYRYELTRNDLSVYLVLRLHDTSPKKGLGQVMHLWHDRRATPIVAYGGFWSVLDEAHISTIAVHPDWRGRGLGEMMLVALMEAAIGLGAAEITLEVRVSNKVAQNLYQKYAFATVGRRKRYYHDNNEDALIMTTPRLDDAEFSARYTRLKSALKRRLTGCSGFQVEPP